MLGRLLNEIPREGIEAGDILLLDIQGFAQHMGITARLDDRLSLIHAYAPARAVVEHHLDAWWQSRIVAAYRIADTY